MGAAWLPWFLAAQLLWHRFLEQLSTAPEVGLGSAAGAALPGDRAGVGAPTFEAGPCAALNASADGANRHHHKHHIFSLDIRVRHRGSWPGPDVSEAYTLDVSAPSIRLKADTVFGALHGLETLGQLVRRGKHEACLTGALRDSPANASSSPGPLSKSKRRRCVLALQETTIKDAPRFRHRGLLIDTARHFLSLGTIKVWGLDRAPGCGAWGARRSVRPFFGPKSPGHSPGSDPRRAHRFPARRTSADAPGCHGGDQAQRPALAHHRRPVISVRLPHRSGTPCKGRLCTGRRWGCFGRGEGG